MRLGMASASSLIRDSGTTMAVVEARRILTLRRAASGAGNTYLCWTALVETPGANP
jgi:hypothetical protein